MGLFFQNYFLQKIYFYRLPEPRCVLYVCMGISDVYNMIAVHEGTVKELKKNLEQLSKQKLDVLFLRGPKGIKVIVNDEVQHFLIYCSKIKIKFSYWMLPAI